MALKPGKSKRYDIFGETKAFDSSKIADTTWDDKETIARAMRNTETTARINKEFDAEIQVLKYYSDPKDYMTKLGVVIQSLKMHLVGKAEELENEIDKWASFIDHNTRKTLMDEYVSGNKAFVKRLIAILNPIKVAKHPTAK